MAISKANAIFAVRNVARYGDTDVYPFPLENHWFFDEEESVADLLMSLDADFEGWLRNYPLIYSTGLSSVGYNGFRAATQIDPLWNAYLLALLLEIGPELESARIPAEKRIVFAYRFKPSNEEVSLFDKGMGWYQFQKTALERAAGSEFIVSTDISDFYARVYHHRLENALKAATTNSEVVGRIMEISKRLSVGETSYGLPVGGQASRMLAELLLNRTDRLLYLNRISFCRFVDDYYLFANTAGDAQSALVQLSDILLTNEGLTLSKAKTRVFSRREFARLSPVAEVETLPTPDEAMTRQFLGFRIVYDPYSPTAEDDYTDLRDQLEQFNITGMLAKELRKSRVDESLTRHLVKAMRFLKPELRDSGAVSIARNLQLLYPIFPSVAILLHKILSDLSESTRDEVFGVIRNLFMSKSHILLVPANLTYAIRILAYDRAEETDAILMDVYGLPTSNMMVKRDILLAMARRRVDYWLSAQLKKFATLTLWEKRALMVGSYILGDEGRHWRQRVKNDLHPADRLFLEWVGARNNGRVWELPL